MPPAEYYEIGSWRQLVSPNGIGVTLDPLRTALIVVDMQRRTNDRHAQLGLATRFFTMDPVRSEEHFSNLERKVIPNARRLLELFRARKALVIYFVVGGTAP